MNASLSEVIAAVDIGNTAIKFNRVKDGKLAGSPEIFPLERANQIAAQETLAAAGDVIIGCSGSQKIADDLAAQIFARGDEALVLSRDCILPFKSDYAPGEAGVDRLANIAAAIESAQKGPAIVIDAGSAITVEMIGNNAHFRGGVILPGFALQARTLNQGTALLPSIDTADTSIKSTLPGTNTATAIRAGIQYSCIGAVEKIIQEYLAQPGMADAQITATGGDALQIASALTKVYPQITIDPQLTLRGLLELARLPQ